MIVEVDTYSGYKADERPIRFHLRGNRYEIVSITDRWYGPADSWFKVRADDGRDYVLRYRLETQEWTLESLVNP